MSDAGDLPTVSVVIACRNSASTLAETLDAVADQHYPGWWEVVVVDNGSSDGTVDLARGYCDRLPSLSVLINPSPGFQARALNYGIAESKGDALVLLDSDDVIAPGYVEAMARALRDAPLVGATIDLDRLNPSAVRQRRARLQEHGIDTFCGYLPAVIGAGMGARRDALEAVGGFDDELPTQHDLDISWRMLLAGCRAGFVPDATVHYRYRTGVRAIFAQERGYGLGEVVLYRKFRGDGMPGRTVPQALASYARVVKALVLVRRPGGGSKLATVAGMAFGRLEGSLRYRTRYL